MRRGCFFCRGGESRVSLLFLLWWRWWGREGEEGGELLQEGFTA